MLSDYNSSPVILCPPQCLPQCLSFYLDGGHDSGSGRAAQAQEQWALVYSAETSERPTPGVSGHSGYGEKGVAKEVSKQDV